VAALETWGQQHSAGVKLAECPAETGFRRCSAAAWPSPERATDQIATYSPADARHCLAG